MLFNSFEYLFLFLPAVFAGYFILCHYQMGQWANRFLALASLFFYGWYYPYYLPIIGISIGFNYFIGQCIQRSNAHKLMWCWFGLILNLLFLGYYKYTDFILVNLNAVFDTQFQLQRLVLPLAISFFTFQQIAFLVDVALKKLQQKAFVEYSLFVSFFPQLLMGPIVHHREMMPQFNDSSNKQLNYEHISAGIMQFSIGLFKKVMLADTLSVWSQAGFSNSANLHCFEAWFSVLAFGLQLYFDFSGYTDMASGTALLFNIKLPTNFNSPWKANNIQDFWMRWHITLTRFLKHYVYIPMSSRHHTKARRALSLIITFLIGGLWHGASWMFVIWGLCHGVALCLYLIWVRVGWFRLPVSLSIALTIAFNLTALVFFRSPSMTTAGNMLSAMYIGKLVWPNWLVQIAPKWLPGSTTPHWLAGLGATHYVPLFLLSLLVMVLVAPNSIEIRDKFPKNLYTALYASLLLVVSIYNLDYVTEFIYFNF